MGYHGAVVHIPQETKLNLHIDLSAYNDLMVYSRREKLVGNHLNGKKVGHGVQAGAKTVQSYQNQERNLKSWSSKVYSRIGNTNGAVQLSGAKAFSLD